MKNEALHTAPHALCPHPEYWTAPDSDSTECEVTELVASFIRAIQPEIVVETGTAFGYTALAIGQALERNGHGKLYTLEPDEGRRKFAMNLAAKEMEWDVLDNDFAYKNFIEFLPTRSLDYTPPGPIQFAWFDSLYQLRVDEFLRYRKMGFLKPGTIVGFHDWTSGIRKHHIDVRAELEKRLVQPGFLKVIYVPTPRGAAFGEVLK